MCGLYRQKVYWQNPVRSIMNSKQLTEYVVLDITLVCADYTIGMYCAHPVLYCANSGILCANEHHIK